MEFSGGWIRGAAEDPKRALDVQKAMERDGMQLRQVDPSCALADPDGPTKGVAYQAVVMAAVSNNGMALQYASAELQGTEDVVVAAVANDGRARAYASAEMRALSKQFLKKENKLILREGVCRTLEGRTFAKDRLRVAEEGYWKVVEEGSETGEWEPVGVGANPRSLINQIEAGINVDVDMDGDIGINGSGKAAAMRQLFVVVHDTEAVDGAMGLVGRLTDHLPDVSHRSVLALKKTDIKEIREKLEEAGKAALELTQARKTFRVKRRQDTLTVGAGGAKGVAAVAGRLSHEHEERLEAADPDIMAALASLKAMEANVDGTLRLDYHHDLITTAMHTEEGGGQIRKQTRVKDRWADLERLPDEPRKDKDGKTLPSEKDTVLSYWRNKMGKPDTYTEATQTRFVWDPEGFDESAPQPRSGIGTVTKLTEHLGDDGLTGDGRPLYKVVFPDDRRLLGNVALGREDAYHAFRGAPPDLQMNKDFVQACARMHGGVLEHAFERFHHDRETVQIAVAQNAFALRFARPELRNDPLMVAAATGIITGATYKETVTRATEAKQLKDKPKLVSKTARDALPPQKDPRTGKALDVQIVAPPKSLEDLFKDIAGGKQKITMKQVQALILNPRTNILSQDEENKLARLVKDKAEAEKKVVLEAQKDGATEKTTALLVQAKFELESFHSQKTKDIAIAFTRPDPLTGVRGTAKDDRVVDLNELYKILTSSDADRIGLNLLKEFAFENPVELNEATFISKPLQSSVVVTSDVDDTGRVQTVVKDLWPGNGPVPADGTNRGALRYADAGLRYLVSNGIERRRQQLDIMAWADMEIKRRFFADIRVQAIIQQELHLNDSMQKSSAWEEAADDWANVAMGNIELGIDRQNPDKAAVGKMYVQAALRKNGYALRRASASVRADKDCVGVAVTWYGAALEFASEELQKDKDIVYAALQAPPLQDPEDEAAALPREHTQDPMSAAFALQKDRPPMDDSFTPPQVIKDPTCWSGLPGSSKKKGGRLDPSDVFNLDASLEDVLYNVTLVRLDGEYSLSLSPSGKKAKAKIARDLKSGLKVQLVNGVMFRGKTNGKVEERREFWSPREEVETAAEQYWTCTKGGTADDEQRDLLKDCVAIAEACHMEEELRKYKDELATVEKRLGDATMMFDAEGGADPTAGTLDARDADPNESSFQERKTQKHVRVDFSSSKVLAPDDADDADDPKEKKKRVANIKQFVHDYLPHIELGADMPWDSVSQGTKDAIEDAMKEVWVPLAEVERASPALQQRDRLIGTAVQKIDHPLSRGVVMLRGGDKKELLQQYQAAAARAATAGAVAYADFGLVEGGKEVLPERQTQVLVNFLPFSLSEGQFAVYGKDSRGFEYGNPEGVVNKEWVNLDAMERMDSRQRVSKNWRVLKWASKEIQEDADWLDGVRERVQEQKNRERAAEAEWDKFVDEQNAEHAEDSMDNLRAMIAFGGLGRPPVSATEARERGSSSDEDSD